MFKVGDLVVLNSGGPLMQVSVVFHERRECLCAWVGPDGGRQEAVFSELNLFRWAA